MSDTLAHVAEADPVPVGEPGPERSAGRTVLRYAVRLLLVLVFALPLLFMLVSSFKPDTQIFGDLDSIDAFLPVGDVSLDNYSAVFDRVPFWQFMMNSVLITVLTVVLGLIVNSMAAFALARLKFRGQGILLGVILATLIVPFETLALPLLWWVNHLPYYDGSIGWLDTYEVQIIPFVANAFSIYLFYTYFDSIPRELDEAAKVDGASWFTIYRRIVMPLSGPAIATVSILTFLPAWNQYLWPLMAVQSESLRPVLVGIDYFSQLTTNWGQIMAYASMITVPVLVMFIAFQRAFINSIATSGVKG
ncbi:carbohydrate ABC transporter permease [Nakamurella flava]|uniref:Carbohydrate ABC transporter permease n=1 Tax=Nakamurella flava TaxID=2576308 RepID=A0A4U6QM73_9ACTN|nr:carbohydrate ABC transporter permease [Nakamurella flava]TKV61228.1 carbohydrate ABC transporter permease [Nakamurella flava]